MTQRTAEELAAEKGMSIGGLLELLLAEHAASRCPPQDSGALGQKLVPLFQDIVDAIGTAARVLAEHPAPPAASRPVAPRPEERETEAPSFQEIQDWLRRVDAKKADPRSDSKAGEFGRPLLRRAG